MHSSSARVSAGKLMVDSEWCKVGRNCAERHFASKQCFVSGIAKCKTILANLSVTLKFEHSNAAKSSASITLPCTLLRSLQRTPDPVSGWVTGRREKKGQGRSREESNGRKEGREGRGV